LWTDRPGEASAQLTVEHLVEIRERVAAELDGRVLDLAAVRLAAFERTLEEAGLPDPDLAARLTAIYFEDRRRGVPLFPDTRQAVERLADRRRLAVVSNGNLRPAESGLGDLIRVWVSAAAVGAAKPDPAVFRIALRRLHTAAEGAVMVGDSLHHDIAGARRAGVRSVWLNRAAIVNDTGIDPDAEIGSLEELPALLAEWEPGSIG
ncbi:MAG: HAD family hydrolase, partial [Acidimicrobiia bacterium]